MIDNDNMALPPPKPAVSAHSSNIVFSPHQMADTIKLPDNTDEDDEDDEEEDDIDDDDEGEDAAYDNARDDEDGDENGQDMDSQFDLLARSLVDSCRAESTPGWSDNFELHNPSNIQLHTTELAPEDSRYSHTVSTILHNQFTRCSDSHTPQHHNFSQSSFATWTSNHHLPPTTTTSQRILKYILFTVPFLHSNTTNVDGDASESVASRLRKTASHEELSANHVLAERRRREKLNERFIILRTLVPLVTKMDKASILGDTIEYVKQLRKKIQDLEARCRMDNSKVAEKRKIRVVDPGGGGGGRAAVAVQVEVSIIENDALVEMQCRHREGLLLDVMKKLRELGMEITTVQSSVDGVMFTAEMRAKVKVRKANNGKKISIAQVKKAIDQILSPL